MDFSPSCSTRLIWISATTPQSVRTSFSIPCQFQTSQRQSHNFKAIYGVWDARRPTLVTYPSANINSCNLILLLQKEAHSHTRNPAIQVKSQWRDIKRQLRCYRRPHWSQLPLLFAAFLPPTLGITVKMLGIPGPKQQ